MIKCYRSRQVVYRKDGRFSRIVGAFQCPAALPDENDGSRVKPGVAVWVRINMELFDKPDIQGCFLFCLPDGRSFDGFPDVNKTAGERPAWWRVLALDKNDPVLKLYDYIDGEKRGYRQAPHYNLLSNAVNYPIRNDGVNDVYKQPPM